MAIEVVEKFDSGASEEGESRSRELRYLIYGTTSRTDALNALASTAPTLLDSLSRKRYRVEPFGAEEWVGTATYGVFSKQSPTETGGSVYNFEISAQTQHITHSLETIQNYAASGTAPDFKGAIGVTRDGVEGCDIYVPQFSFSETHYVADASVTDSYISTVYNLCGKVNDATFKGLPAKEVLFLGCTGSKRGADDWELTFRFIASKSVTGLSIGPISGVAKGGWEYLWVRFEDDDDDDAKAIVKVPKSVHVERVYEAGDFSALGL